MSELAENSGIGLIFESPLRPAVLETVRDKGSPPHSGRADTDNTESTSFTTGTDTSPDCRVQDEEQASRPVNVLRVNEITSGTATVPVRGHGTAERGASNFNAMDVALTSSPISAIGDEASMLPPSTVKSTAELLPLDEFESQRKKNRRTARYFFISLSVLYLFQFAFVSGYTPSILTALQTHYGLTTTQVATIPSSYDAAGLFVVIPISFIGGSSTSRFGHRPYWIGASGLLMATGSLVWSLPHLLGPPYQPNDALLHIDTGNKSNATYGALMYCPINGSQFVNDTSRWCPQTTTGVDGGNGTLRNFYNSPTAALATFIFGHVLNGIGSLAPLSLGPPYMQEGYQGSASFALFLGILYSTTAIGPVLGFGLGAACQSLYVNSFSLTNGLASAPPGLLASSPAWVGAWWLGYLILTLCLVLSSIPLFFFPRTLALPRSPNKSGMASSVASTPTVSTCGDGITPSTDADCSILAVSDNTTLNSASQRGKLTKITEEDDESPVLANFGSSFREFFRAALSLFRNPIWLLNNAIFISISSPVQGFVLYLKQYIQFMFAYDASTASLVMGGILVPAAALGVAGGGIINKRFGANFMFISGRHLFYAMAGFGAIVIMALVRCPSAGTIGVHMAYPNHFDTSPKLASPVAINSNIYSPDAIDSFISNRSNYIQVTDGCNAACGCRKVYDPVCASDGHTYFSGCHAGCSVGSDGGMTNCKCVIQTNSSGLEPTSAVPGPCSNCLPSMAVFLAITFFAAFLMSLGHNGTMLMLLRSVPRDRRALGMGMHIWLFKLFAAIPAPLLFGAAVDSACIFTTEAEDKCPSQKFDPTDPSATSSNCLLYDSEQLARAFFGISLTYACAGFILVIALVSYLARHRLRVLICARPQGATVKSIESAAETDLGASEPKPVIPRQTRWNKFVAAFRPSRRNDYALSDSTSSADHSPRFVLGSS